MTKDVFKYDKKEVDKGINESMSSGLSSEDIDSLLDACTAPEFKTKRYKVKSWAYWRWHYIKAHKYEFLFSFTIGFILGWFLK